MGCWVHGVCLWGVAEWVAACAGLVDTHRRSLSAVLVVVVVVVVEDNGDNVQ